MLSPAPAAACPDARLVADVRAGSSSAAAELFRRHRAAIERLLFALLGPEPEAEDLLHEVFVRALEGIGSLEEPSRFRSWLTGIAVHTAREWIRRKSRRRWLRFVEDLPERPAPSPSEEVSEAARCTSDVLLAMSPRERSVFMLRFVDGAEIADVAVACETSVSTAKRRLKDAERHFVARAMRSPPLRTWLAEGGRWANDRRNLSVHPTWSGSTTTTSSISGASHAKALSRARQSSSASAIRR